MWTIIKKYRLFLQSSIDTISIFVWTKLTQEQKGSRQHEPWEENSKIKRNEREFNKGPTEYSDRNDKNRTELKKRRKRNVRARA